MGMVSAKVTSKGQITIPAAIRSALGLETGHRVDFVVLPNGRVELAARSGSAASMRGRLQYKGPHVPDEAFEAAARNNASARFSRSGRQAAR